MRELTVVGLDPDGKHIICETACESGSSGSAEKFKLLIDDRLRAAVRGEEARAGQTQLDIGISSMLRPREIQARVRAGASIEQLAAAAGVDVSRIERFAHPVLLERSRAAELATAAHPVLADGPAVLTLLEVVTSALLARGLNPDHSSWDAWRNEDGRWTAQLSWKAGRSDNVAHFRFAPGAHGGTVTAIDDAAALLIDPDADRPLRPLASVAQLDFGVQEAVVEPPVAEGEAVAAAEEPVAAAAAGQSSAAKPARARRGRPEVPAWEDVLLGVRSSGQR
ncbi:MAG TPA: septation protein SepH [Mycobacterium sp.]|nr:septation protein SepH [Mycobacterium sp.]